MTRKLLIEFLESIIYPKVGTGVSIITFQDREDTCIAIDRKALEIEFEKLLVDAEQR